MEAHKLRFVRCPKCSKVLVEYPSIPVYKCGGCDAVLKAKYRAVPVTQAGSRSDEHVSFPSSLKGSPQSSRSICSDEHRAVSSVDRPCEAMADGSVSSTVNNTDSCGVAEKHSNEETGFLTDGDVQNSGVVVKETRDKDTGGTDSSSDLTEKGGIVDTGEIAKEGEVNNIDTREMSTALYEKAGVVLGEDRLPTYEEMHVESHEALIEELERSLSFTSDDDGYFSDGVENSGLSDALRKQMGSRRFTLGGKTNDASRSDPHGRLIEELEMSFSDAEDPMEQHAAAVDVVHGNVHNKNPQTLGAESAHPYEESLSSFDSGHLKYEETSEQENMLIDKDIRVREECHTEENSSANYAEEDIADTSHESGKDRQSMDMETAHQCEGNFSSLDDINIKAHSDDAMEEYQTEEISAVNHAEEDIADTSHESGKDLQSVDVEMPHPCKGSVSSLDDSNIKDHSYDAMEECHIEENSTADYAEEDIADRAHGSCKDQQSVDGEIAHPCEGSVSSLDDSNIKDHSDDAMKECRTEDDNTASRVNGNAHIVTAYDVIVEVSHDNSKDRQFTYAKSVDLFERSVSLVNDDNGIFKQNSEPSDLTADCTQETEEGCMEDDNVNYVQEIENLVFSDEDISERVHGNQELMADCHARENEESHMEDDANIADANENIAAADEHAEERVDTNERGKDQQSLESEGAYLGGGVLSSFNTEHTKSEQSFQQNELIADGTKEKEEADMEDSNVSATVASFSSLPYKRTQHKVSSFNKNKEEIPYGYKASQLRQGLSLDSEDFKSVQNFIESQIDGTSSSRSSGSPSQGVLVHRTSNNFNNIVRHERLQKMDELRDQLSRLSSRKGSEKSYQKRDLEYQQQSNGYDIEQHPQSVDGDSIPSSYAIESYYGHGRPPRYQPPNPFSPTHTYTHCHFGHAQAAHIPHNHDPWEFNSYYQSSYAESTILDHESLRSSYKEQKRVVRKHILRPLSGASPYTICNSCFNLVQMPSDIYISKTKIGKMQCGKCSKVLALSFASVHQADAKIGLDVAQQPYNLDDSMIANSEDIASYYAECLAGGPISINEEYGASFKTSLSTQAGSSLAATQSGKKVSDSALHRLMGYDSASQLLRHSRVFEDGYQRRHSRVFEDGYESFESMVPVSSRVSRRKNK